jgi:hypothetical protein
MFLVEVALLGSLEGLQGTNLPLEIQYCQVRHIEFGMVLDIPSNATSDLPFN